MHYEYIRNSLSGVAGEEGPPEHEEAGEGALRVAQYHALGLFLQPDPKVNSSSVASWDFKAGV